MNTSKIVDGNKVTNATITIPAGIYDWCITNPSPNDCVWIAADYGNIGGRKDNFVFEAGKHYTFTVSGYGSNDCVDMTVDDDDELNQGNTTNVDIITSTSYDLSGLTASTFYTVYVQSVKGNKTSEWSKTSFTTLNEGELYLYDDQDNSGVLASFAGRTLDVTLAGRTLYKNGDWNTLCLPFKLTDGDTYPGYSLASGGDDGLTFTGTPLQGAEVMCFDHASFNPAAGSLEIIFVQDYSVPAGEPFLVRWTKADPSDPDLEDLVDPVFSGVTITAQAPQTSDHSLSYAAFVGTYSPVEFVDEDRSILFLGGGSTLYYPDGQATTTIGSQRAYFQLKNGLTIGEPTSPDQSGVRSFILNFGEESNGIENGQWSMFNGQWSMFNGQCSMVNQMCGTPSTVAGSTV